MHRSLLRRLASTPSSVDSRLPYNWNWQRGWKEAETLLSRSPIVVIDIGARGDPPPELDSMTSYVRRIGFEPDRDECDRLNARSSGTYYPYLLAGSVGSRSLHLYRDPGYSSSLRLTDRFQQLWIGNLPIDHTRECPATTLDVFLSENSGIQPDFVKLDTQGTELDVLQGADRTLKSVGMVEVEVEFLPVYEGQALFQDVTAFMFERGYELLYLNRHMVNRKQIFDGPSRGQLLFGDALFGKREDALRGLSDEQVAKYCILLCQYGHMDIAWQVYDAHAAVARLIPELRSIFRGHRGTAWRAALMQVDKVIALALHARRYNQRGTDSDRCWPVR